MVEAYFRKLIFSLKGKSDLCNHTLEILKNSNKKISKKIIKSANWNLKGVDLQDLIDKNLIKLNAADVDLNLRRAKLREAKRFKKDLEAKLGHIKESIDTLNSIEEMPLRTKPNLLDREVRHEYYEEEKTKAQEMEKKSKDYYLEQKKRKDKIKKHIQELEKVIQEEKLLKQEQLKKQKELKEKEYKTQLVKMHKKKEMREKELEDIKNYDKSFKEIKKIKPLYVQISEKYWKEIEMPELEKRKSELSKKRLMNSISTKQLQEHAKWYENIKQDNLRKSQNEQKTKSIDRKIQSSDSTFTFWKQKLVEEEKQLKEEQKRAQEQRAKMLDKRITYGNFVKQTFLPSIDLSKRSEIEKRKENLASSSKILKSSLIDSGNSSKMLKNSSQNPIPENAIWKPHKFKENPLVPKAALKKEGKIVDYLGELRKVREDTEKEKKEAPQEDDIVQFEWNDEIQNLPEAERIKKIQKESKKLERALKQKEMAMSVTAGTAQSLKYSDDINEMLINSIKAKLSVLEKAS